MDEKRKIEELLESISNNDKYNGCVFRGPGIYFVIGNGSLWEIPDDASCLPKGGWFPDIVCGPSVEENTCLQEMMEELDFDEYFFREYLYDYDEYDNESILEYFEEDEDALKIYRKMKKKVKSGKTPFATMDDFVSAVSRYGLEADCLYYEWEGEYIDFHDNVADTGKSRGCYDSLSDGEWIELLQDIDEHIVTLD